MTASDFYQVVGESRGRLNRTELRLLDHVVRHLPQVSAMTIRELAAACFVSTTSVLRFVRRLGFTGYTDFTECLRRTAAGPPGAHIPARVLQAGYAGEYLKNVAETLRVLSPRKVEDFVRLMAPRPRVVVLADGFSRQAAHYVHYLLTALGFWSLLPGEAHELEALPRMVRAEDVVLVLSYSGENPAVLATLERILAAAAPTVVTVTGSATNTTFALGDLDLYVFSDTADYRGMDVTSRLPMIALLEHLLTAVLAADGGPEAGAGPGTEVDADGLEADAGRPEAGAGSQGPRHREGTDRRVDPRERHRR